MATLQATIGRQNFTDKRETQGQATSPIEANIAHYASRSSLVAALQDGTFGAPATYTNAYVAHMTMNDLVYAVRKLYDNAGI